MVEAPLNQDSTHPSPKRRWLQSWRCWAVFWSVFVALQWISLLPPKLIVSHDTTRLAGPLRDDGTIDYCRAFDEHCAAGATPDNNAAVEQLAVMGDLLLPLEVRDRLLNELGAAETPRPELTLIDYGPYRLARLVSNDKESLERETRVIAFETAAIESRPWRRGEFPIAAKWLDDIGPALDRFLNSGRRVRWHIPGVLDETLQADAVDLTKFWTAQRHAARMVAVRMRMSLGDGRLPDVIRDAESLRQLARNLATVPELTTRMRVAFLVNLQLEFDAALLELDSVDGVALQLRLDQFADAWPGVNLDAIDVGERWRQLSVTQERWRSTKFGRPGIDVNRAMRSINTSIDALLGKNPPGLQRNLTIARTSVSPRPQRPQRGFIEWTSHCLMFDLRSMVTDDFSTFVAEDAPIAYQVEVRQIQRQQLMRVAYAVARHEQRTGSPLESLDQLQDELPADVMVDLFSRSPLRYRRVDGGCQVYSVGPNLTDDHGKIAGKDPLDWGVFIRTRTLEPAPVSVPNPD